MKDGTNNEDPTFDKLKRETFVLDLFEVGLLRDKNEPSIGVSPDGVALIEDDKQDRIYACVEIKTRVAESTINIAEIAAKKHGRIVHCQFDDLQFK